MTEYEFELTRESLTEDWGLTLTGGRGTGNPLSVSSVRFN